ncbi:hypothetical protein KCV87_23775 [Actinosynnema pretiosum subsp. pretiosum]|uniref:Polyketide cyclase / dehydrase and lipid transport n=1 Tax=Actinosynnema pretiosum subsp. pretiosum TaxID=103721 RepID=A0AA45R276_9PSEU|nr:hypothetical protein APASM_6387 [Actinosynnema pretiosum subsp. pretiosum]QUF02476.1 hypothetical protein KCV87_23775 [Actinosynnema pretiosum subsp. pretiosum]
MRDDEVAPRADRPAHPFDTLGFGHPERGYSPAMTTYTYRAPVDLPAQRLFEFVARPENLTEHLPGIEPTGVRVDESVRRVTWDGGEAVVTEDGAGCSRIEVRLEAEQTPERQRELQEAVAALSHLAAAEVDSQAARSGDGWY